MEAAKGMISQIFLNFQPALIPIMITSYYKVFLLIMVGLVIHWLPSSFKESYRGWFIKSHIIVKLLIVVFIVFILYQMKSSEIQPFIYFQF
jgi:hypothetical protein